MTQAGLGALPIPPVEMRALVGRPDAAAFDDPDPGLALGGVEESAFDSVLDFGCGCGRLARQLIQQRPPPARYLGIDVHGGMIEWCRRNLTPHASRFEFLHFNVAQATFNTGRHKPVVLPLPAGDDEFSLVMAVSVFTHLPEYQARHYLREIARVLRPDGVFHATWFTFDKRDFPMMQDFQNALFINDFDPTNAVIFDRAWIRDAAAAVGLRIIRTTPPDIRGFHWTVLMRPAQASLVEATFEEDTAPRGIRRPPLAPAEAGQIGLGDAREHVAPPLAAAAPPPSPAQLAGELEDARRALTALESSRLVRWTRPVRVAFHRLRGW